MNINMDKYVGFVRKVLRIRGEVSKAGHCDTGVGPSDTPILSQLNLGGGVVCRK